MKKRLLAIALALCLCLALLPGAALGEGPQYQTPPTIVTTAAALAAALPSGEHETIPVAELGADITVDEANSVHAMGRLIVPESFTLTIASGAAVQANVVNHGTILVQSGGALETTMGGDIENHGAITVEKGASIVSQMGGQVVNNEGASLTLEGTFRCGSVNYDSTDHLWFANEGTVSGRGDLVVYDAGAGDAERDSVDLDAMIGAAMGALRQTRRYGDGYWDDVNILKEVEVSSLAELKAAFPKGGRKVAGEDVPGNMDVIAVLEKDVTVTDGDVQTMGKIIVPEGKELTVAAGGVLEIGIENRGTVTVQSGGALATTQGGDIVNNGTLTVQEGASLTSQMGGSVVNGGSGVMTLGGNFRCGVVYTVEGDTAVWFRKDGGTVTCTGAVTVYQARPEDPVDLDRAAALLQQTLGTESAVTEIPAAPALPEAGGFYGSKTIEIVCAAVGASVYYTTNDAEPTAETGTRYTAPFSIDKTTTVKAVAILKGMRSDVASAAYTLRSGGGVGGGSKTYKITVAATENGTAAASKSTAAEGEKITVTAAPAEGFELDSITVKGEKAGSIAVKDGAFTMPADDVTVTVKFREKKAEARPALAFTDVKPGDWFYEAVQYAADQGVMNGVGGGRFDPDGATTRAMIVAILYRMEGEPAIRSGMPFNDVKESDWYAKAVSWAESQGIVNGFEDGAFRPNDPITREQLAAILYRYAQSKGQGFRGLWSFRLDFPDALEVSDWAIEAMSWMVMQGVVGGKDGKLAPGGSASRAEAAAMLMRFAAL